MVRYLSDVRGYHILSQCFHVQQLQMSYLSLSRAQLPVFVCINATFTFYASPSKMSFFWKNQLWASQGRHCQLYRRWKKTDQISMKYGRALWRPFECDYHCTRDVFNLSLRLEVVCGFRKKTHIRLNYVHSFIKMQDVLSHIYFVFTAILEFTSPNRRPDVALQHLSDCLSATHALITCKHITH